MKTHREFLADVSMYPYKVAGEYQGSFVKIPVVCDVCGYPWEAMPSNLVQGSGCPRCAIRRRGGKRRKNAALEARVRELEFELVNK